MVFMRFFRELRGYIARPNEIAAARRERLKFSFFVQVHIFVAFVVTASMISGVNHLVTETAHQLQKISPGVVISKAGSELAIAGITQPITFGEPDSLITVDTTGVLTERPVSSTMFIGKNAIELAPTDNQAAQKMLWSEGRDFVVNVDELRELFVANQATVHVLFVMFLFVYFTLSSLIFSSVVVATWSVLASIATRFMAGWSPLTFREALRLHTVAITGPLVLWGLFVAIGFRGAAAVELFSFVVYSVIALRVTNSDEPPAPAHSSGNKAAGK